jgi:hypothetical protein
MTLTGGDTDKYMRFGDTYVKCSDGSLDVKRTGAEEFTYPAGERADVEGGQSRGGRRRLFGR